MTKKRRWATVALLIALPSIAAAQHQQGSARATEYLDRARRHIEKKRFKAALAVFDSLLRTAPGSRDAALGRAKMLAWSGRIREAVKAYERWLEAHPNDTEAAELLALALSWARRFDDAERIYKLLALAGSPEAERGLARIAAWRGDHARAERLYRAIVAKRPTDSEAWLGLGRVLIWSHRPREAREALQRAVATDPTNRDAAELLRSVETRLAPHIDPAITSMTDTDGNHLVTMGAIASFAAPWDGELSIHARNRAAANGPLRASSLNVGVALSRNVGRYALRGSLAGIRLDDVAAAPGSATRNVLSATAAVTAQVGRRAHLAGAVSRDAFDETPRLIRNGIVSTTFGAGASLDLGRGFSFGAEAERAQLDGGTPNTRTAGSGSLTWRAPAILSLATSVRTFGYTTDPGEGYFAPHRYVLGEACAQIKLGRELGWSVSIDGGVGAQSIDARALGTETRPAARGGLSISYSPAPGLEWAIAATTANAASPATSSLTSYRATGVSARARVRF